MSSYTKFNAPLCVQYHETVSKQLGKDYWVVTKDFIYYIGKENSESWVLIPAGYLTDGASVPRPFWSFIPPWGQYGQAAVVHDYLCDYGQVNVGNELVNIERVDIDQVMIESMSVLKVPFVTRFFITLALWLYRKTIRPKVPSITKEKRTMQTAVYSKFGRTGTFEL